MTDHEKSTSLSCTERVPEVIREQREVLEIRDALARGRLDDRRAALRALLSKLTDRGNLSFDEAARVQAAAHAADEGDRVAALWDAFAELVVSLGFDTWPPGPDDWPQVRGEQG